LNLIWGQVLHRDPISATESIQQNILNNSVMGLNSVSDVVRVLDLCQAVKAVFRLLGCKNSHDPSFLCAKIIA